MKVRITNIQRFSLHDGPGIRTTVFLKGCNLKCPWCANPENIDFEKTKFVNETTKENGYFGRDIDINHLYEEIIKDRRYYTLNNGGVTFSGGEPLLQIKALEPLLAKLKEEKINICIETALQVPSELVDIATKYIDEFIVDIKILNPTQCLEVLNGNIDLYIKNLEILDLSKKIDIFRVPLVKEYTLKNNNIDLIIELLSRFKAKKVEIFKIHNLAESKYKSIGKQIAKFSNISDEIVKNIYDRIKKKGVNVEIIKL